MLRRAVIIKLTSEDPYESEYEFYYDANWNLLGGMDKFDNGATITIYDENWNATTSVDELVHNRRG